MGKIPTPAQICQLDHAEILANDGTRSMAICPFRGYTSEKPCQYSNPTAREGERKCQSLRWQSALLGQKIAEFPPAHAKSVGDLAFQATGKMSVLRTAFS